jgi:hypothetical protein
MSRPCPRASRAIYLILITRARHFGPEMLVLGEHIVAHLVQQGLEGLKGLAWGSTSASSSGFVLSARLKS